MNPKNILNSNFILDNKNSIPRDSLNPSISENNQTINVEKNINSNYFPNENDLINNNFFILQRQNKNLQEQILILTKRIKEYEKDYITNNDKKTLQIKEFAEKEKELVNLINTKNEIINSLNDENNKLKIYINQTEQDLNLLRKEVKNLLELKIKREKDKELEKNIINNQNEDFLDIMKKYSDEIIYLKEQNNKLVNNLNLLTQNNNDKYRYISNEENIKSKIMQSKFENYLNDFIKEINEEIFVLSQWIETYLGKEYDKGYEIPSLINDIDNNNIYMNKVNLINFNLIKSSLEKSIININSIINIKENEIIKLNNILKNKEDKYNEIKKDLVNVKDKYIELNKENKTLKFEKENESKMILSNKTFSNDLDKNYENLSEYSLNYLKE